MKKKFSLHHSKAYPSMPALNAKHKTALERFRKTGNKGNPFFRAWDIPGSISNANRMVSRVTGELTHFLSDLEYHHGLIVDHTPDVVDFVTNYPIDPQVSWKICCDTGLPHPQVAGLAVVTVDFFIKVRGPDGKETWHMRDVKPATALHDKEVLDNLSIPFLYCQAKGTSYGIYTDATLNDVLAKNLAEFHHTTDPEHFQIKPEEIEAAKEVMEACFADAETLSEVAIISDRKLGFTGKRRGSSLTIAHYLIIQHRWHCDLTEPFDPGTSETKALVSFNPALYDNASTRAAA